ncbi:MAG: hypothetical protein Kow0031_29990 [Anaerolineae bacterium]
MQLVLIAPFMALTVLAVTLIGAISYRNGQNAVNEVAYRLRREINARIDEHLQTFLSAPLRINQANVAFMGRGELDPTSQLALERHFLEQIKLHDSVTSIYFGNTAGGLADAGREGADGSLYFIATDDFAAGIFRKFAANARGERTHQLDVVPNFDARQRPWYTGAVAQQDVVWSAPYILFTGQDMAISVSSPVYNTRQQLLGVVAVDLFLSHLSDFLAGMEIGQSGQSFILEPSGLLIATSTGEPPLTRPEGDTLPRRIAAHDSQIPLTRAAAAALLEQFGSYDGIETAQQFEFLLDGQRQLGQVTPLQDEHGLDWLIVTVIPEADFMAQITASNRITLLLMMTTLLVIAGVGVMIGHKLTQHIQQVNRVAGALANGEWGQSIPHDSHIREISDLFARFNHMGRQLGRMVSDLNHEISARKRTEEALETTLEQFKTLVNNLQMGVLVESGSRQIIHTNQAFCELFGLPGPEAILGAQCDETAQAASALFEAPAGFIARIKQILAEGRPVTGEELTLKDGRVFERGFVPIYLHGELNGNMWLYRDISHRKEVEQQLVQQERLAAVGQLSAGVAHDFNNILTGIIGFTELIQMSPDTPAALQPRLEAINNAAQQAAHLVSQLLDFSRKSIRRTQSLELAVFVREIITFLERTIPENVHFKLTVEPGKYPIEADPTQLHQVITNLAVNARDAMPGGGKINIGLSRVNVAEELLCAVCNRPIAGEWVRLRVGDTGSGIPPELLSRVFEPFFTTKEIGRGSGLGLSQVAGIVEQTGGHATVMSRAGEGTTFTVYLPPLAAPTVRQPAIPPPVRAGQKETILLVEDEPTVLASTLAMLEYLDYQVITATSGEEALALLQQPESAIDLVLSDMMMADMDGETLFNRLQAGGNSAKVVMMSGYPLEEKGARLLDKGVVAWLQKPISIRTLSQAIGRALAGVTGRWDD